MSDTSDPTISSPRRTPLHWADAPRRRGLPRDLAEKAVERFGLLALIYAGVHIVYVFIPDTGVPNSTLPEIMSMVFAVISVGVFLFARFVRIDPYRMIDLALAFEVIGAIGIEMHLLWWPGGWWEGATTVFVSGVSWTCVWIVMFPLLVPSSPGKVALVSLLSASIRPLFLLVALAKGAPQPPGAEAIVWIAPNYICVGIAIFSAYVMYGLGEAVFKAQKLGSYKLIERLGAGGMGEVWRAEHHMLARPAAVKLIRAQGPPGSSGVSEQRAKRFEREAQATATLQSPHTVSLFDFGVSRDGTFYYVMELLEGLDLRALVERFGPIGAGRTIHLLAQACESLAEAHSISLVHRDIKPANLYVCRLGLRHDFVKVLDFGLVKHDPAAVTNETALTTENAAAGTPQFMAPEVALGKPADARSDIYALGCTAYWMLSGQQVFEGSNPMQVVVDHIRAEPRRPSERAEVEIPCRLEEVVMSCLAKDPATRPQTAAELAAKLRNADGTDGWDDAAAARWWRMHLPEQAAPA